MKKEIENLEENKKRFANVYDTKIHTAKKKLTIINNT